MNIWQNQDLFSARLREACARHKSISKVCRDLGINRQQFNKYLSGSSFPSANNLVRICGYLDIDGYGSGLATSSRRQAPGGHGTSGQLLLGSFLERINEANPDARRRIERYAGYYHSYYLSPAHPGQILKSISRIHEKQGLFFDKTLERIVDRNDPHKKLRSLHKYNGDVLHTNDRLYVLHQTIGIHQTLSMVAFYPSYSPTPRILSGVFVSVSSGPGRQPFASRVVYEYCGIAPDLRRMISACGLYPVGSGEISDEIAKRLDNHVDAHDTVLRAMEY